MNKSIKKCCICSNSETGEFIMIGDNKYHLSCIEKMQKEKQELKEQLDELQAVYNNMFKCHCNRVQVETLLSQQKEFIGWLESNLEALEMCDRELILTNNKKEIKAYKEVLSKYKEIIGVKDE